MVRNATKIDFRTSKMAAGSHFVKQNHTKRKKELRIDLKWKLNELKSEFRTSKMGAGGHFVKILKIKVLY